MYNKETLPNPRTSTTQHLKVRGENIFAEFADVQGLLLAGRLAGSFLTSVQGIPLDFYF